jgi:hypothetical protein
MPNDTTLTDNATGACSTKARLIPTFDRQQTSASASTSASLVKQRLQYLGKTPVFSGGSHTLYGPIATAITYGDAWIDTMSWNAAGGADEVVELRNASGQTIWRGAGGGRFQLRLRSGRSTRGRGLPGPHPRQRRVARHPGPQATERLGRLTCVASPFPSPLCVHTCILSVESLGSGGLTVCTEVTVAEVVCTYSHRGALP